MRKRFACNLLLFLAVLLLVGCSTQTQEESSAILSDAQESSAAIETHKPAVEPTKSPKDIAAIQKDYEENATIFQEGGDPLYVKDFVITKRRTDEKSYTDTVYATATMVSENGIFQFIQDCTITYGLYNNGWVLDNIIVTETKDMPLSGTDYSIEELADALRMLGYSGITDISVSKHTTDLEGGRDHYSLTARDVHTYMTEVLDLDLVFHFDPMFGWSLYDSKADIYNSEQQWNFGGKYQLYLTKDYSLLSGTQAIDMFDVLHDQVRLDGEDWILYNVKTESFKEFVLGTVETNDTLRDDLIRYGYSARCDNADWQDIQYVTVTSKGFFYNVYCFGRDHIYRNCECSHVDDFNHVVHYEFEQELMPIKGTELTQAKSDIFTGAASDTGFGTMKYIPGVYKGTAKGWMGDIVVSVTVDESRILAISVGDHSETAGIGTKAVDSLPDAIIKANTLDVDVVSGATVTSKSILNAVNDALQKAEAS